MMGSSPLGRALSALRTSERARTGAIPTADGAMAALSVFFTQSPAFVGGGELSCQRCFASWATLMALMTKGGERQTPPTREWVLCSAPLSGSGARGRTQPSNFHLR